MSAVSLARRLGVGVAALGVVVAGTVSGATPSAAATDTVVRPLNASIVVTGAGWGHGIGMSQYGAYGAADAGLGYAKILDFYYPGTTLSDLPAGNRISVWITADNDNRLHFAPASGLKIVDSSGKSWSVPTGSGYKRWRISRSGSSRVLHYLNSSGSWVKKTTSLSASRLWTVKNTSSGYVTVKLPGGAGRDLRDSVSLRFSGSGAKTVNTLSMENYLRGVVPAEMPAGWPAEALKTQAVAARSYAAKTRSTPLASIYDICDTTSCQVYKGLASRSGSTRTVNEYATTNAAIAATADQVLTGATGIALTMFSSSNGGYSAPGSAPYLTAHADPYDGRMRNQAWSVALSSAKIQGAYPSIGTFTAIQVTARDGFGPWGGRASTVVITGTSGSVTVTGSAFKSKFGLKERLFLIVGGLKPGTGNWDRWQALGGTTSWVGAPTSSEVAVAGGLDARFAGADLFWSSATGSKYLTGDLLDAYRGAGGPAGDLGFPRTDVVKTSAGGYADFQQGRITCLTGKECVVAYG